MKMIVLIEIGRHQVIVKSSWFEVSSKKTRLTLTFTDWVKEESSATNRSAARVGSDVTEDLGRVCALGAEDPCKFHVCVLVNADVCALVNAHLFQGSSSGASKTKGWKLGRQVMMAFLDLERWCDCQVTTFRI